MVVNMSDWSARSTLDVIGESESSIKSKTRSTHLPIPQGAFEYKFDSVNGKLKDTKLGNAISTVL